MKHAFTALVLAVGLLRAEENPFFVAPIPETIAAPPIRPSFDKPLPSSVLRLGWPKSHNKIPGMGLESVPASPPITQTFVSYETSSDPPPLPPETPWRDYTPRLWLFHSFVK